MNEFDRGSGGWISKVEFCVRDIEGWLESSEEVEFEWDLPWASALSVGEDGVWFMLVLLFSSSMLLAVCGKTLAGYKSKETRWWDFMGRS